MLSLPGGADLGWGWAEQGRTGVRQEAWRRQALGSAFSPQSGDAGRPTLTALEP